MPDKGTILIVDDELSARNTLEAFLAPEGYNLLFARDGLVALEQAVQFPPDLILLDVMMPEMDGFTVCRQLRAHAQLAPVHIIMLTALDDRESRLRGLAAGADDFISKPFDWAELQVRVRTVMQLNRYRQMLDERARFEWVVERALDGFVLLDEAGHLLYVNPQARRYLDIASADGAVLPAEPFMILATRQYQCRPPEAWDDWPAIPADRQAVRYLVRPASSAAGALWLQVDLIMMHTLGDARYLVQLRDVTEQILTRACVWTFDSQIAHKIATPLNQLTRVLQHLDQTVPELSPAELQSGVSEAYRSAQELQTRILSIFEYLAVTAHGPARAGDCPLSAIPELVATLQAELALPGLTLTADAFAPTLKVHLPCHLLAQVLWELCENARNFHPTGAPTLEISVTLAPQGLLLRVQDDGIHLPPPELEKIWQPYYQPRGVVPGGTPGMGLGLAVVAALVWSTGGTCRACNREDRPGLVIELALPIVESVF